jgi:chaperonin GroES
VNLRPIKDQVVVRPDPAVEKIGAIFVPEVVNADNPNYFPMTSTVVAVGPGRYEDGERVIPDVQVGDRVVHNRYAGNQVTCDDDRVLYVVMRESDIIAHAKELPTILPPYMAAEDEGVKDYGNRDPFADRM